MNFETKYIWESLPLLLQGLQLTILISMVGLAGGFIIGLLAGVCRALGGGIAKTLSLIFVELIRGTPIMVQVMFIYFALGRCEQVPDMRSSYSSGAHPRGTS